MPDTNILFHKLHQTVRMLTKEMNERLKQYGLYCSQWTILYILKHFGSMTQTAIWQYLNVEAPTITRTLATLEKNGWVHRKQGKDKRERIVMLTEKAQQKLPEVEMTLQDFEKDMLLNVSNNQQTQLLSLLREIGKSAYLHQGEEQHGK